MPALRASVKQLARFAINMPSLTALGLEYERWCNKISFSFRDIKGEVLGELVIYQPRHRGVNGLLYVSTEKFAAARNDVG